MITLKEYFEMRLSALEKATDLAKENMEKRLEGMNEFRGQLKDQVSTFVTKEAYETKNEQLQQQIQGLQRLVYTGVGIMVAVEILIKFIV